jgi:hypothetical protein
MEFKRLLAFERSASGLFTEADVMELEIALMLKPDAGALIPGGKGLRKIRRPLPGRGKSSGARVIYYYIRTMPRSISCLPTPRIANPT